MKVKWIKACQWMLGILGISATISSCDGSNGFMRVEYGMPNMDYSVKGKVVDSKTGKGIKGIEVSHEPYFEQIDTTGADGNFEIFGNTWPEKEFRIELKDIDPEKDGSYASKIETVNLKQVKKGSGSWYSGSFEAEGVILKMDEENQE